MSGCAGARHAGVYVNTIIDGSASAPRGERPACAVREVWPVARKIQLSLYYDGYVVKRSAPPRRRRCVRASSAGAPDRCTRPSDRPAARLHRSSFYATLSASNLRLVGRRSHWPPAEDYVPVSRSYHRIICSASVAAPPARPAQSCTRSRPVNDEAYIYAELPPRVAITDRVDTHVLQSSIRLRTV